MKNQKKKTKKRNKKNQNRISLFQLALEVQLSPLNRLLIFFIEVQLSHVMYFSAYFSTNLHMLFSFIAINITDISSQMTSQMKNKNTTQTHTYTQTHTGTLCYNLQANYPKLRFSFWEFSWFQRFLCSETNFHGQHNGCDLTFTQIQKHSRTLTWALKALVGMVILSITTSDNAR